jgi:hypothetical protein
MPAIPRRRFITTAGDAEPDAAGNSKAARQQRNSVRLELSLYDLDCATDLDASMKIGDS